MKIASHWSWITSTSLASSVLLGLVVGGIGACSWSSNSDEERSERDRLSPGVEIAQFAHGSLTQQSKSKDKSDPPCKAPSELRPVLDCVARRGTEKVAFFGYANSSGKTLVVPPGGHNHLAPSGPKGTPNDEVLPSVFAPGERHHLFAVKFQGPRVSWKLGTQHAVADGTAPECPKESCETDETARLRGEQIEAAAAAVAAQVEALSAQIRADEVALEEAMASETLTPETFESMRAQLAERSLTLLELQAPDPGMLGGQSGTGDLASVSEKQP